MFRRATAFTLLEVLISLTVLVALALMAWPVMESQIIAAELPESASRVRSMLYMTRSSAMFENRRHRIRFAPGEQQPVIEYEADPMGQPGQYFPVKSSWAREPILLKDAQVHRIEIGRPDFLTPVSATESAEDQSTEEQLTKSRAEAEAAVGETVETIQNAEGQIQEEGIDPNRPPIIFEVDGSADWAMVVVARRELTEQIDEEVDQLWVVLDGRTGLATVREQVTQEQLADPSFYIVREKLEMPDATAPEDLTLSIPVDDTAAEAAADPGAAFGQGAGGAIGGEAIQPTQQPPVDPSTLPQPGQIPGLDGNPVDPAEVEQATEEDPLAQLEKELAESDLSEAEKEEIRKSFQEQNNQEEKDADQN